MTKFSIAPILEGNSRDWSLPIPRRNTSNKILESRETETKQKHDGNKTDTCFRHVSMLLSLCCRHVSVLFPCCFRCFAVRPVLLEGSSHGLQYVSFMSDTLRG